MRHELDDAERSRGGHRSALARRGVRTVSPEELPPDPTTHAECVACQVWTVKRILVGDIDARTGHEAVLGYAVIARTLKETEDLRRQIAELRAELKAYKKRVAREAA